MGKLIEMPPFEYVKECLSYNPQSGELIWKARPLHHFKSERIKRTFTRTFTGKLAGRITSTGHISVNINGHDYLAHRLCWYLHYGVAPKRLKHRNNNLTDNRIENLYEPSKANETLHDLAMKVEKTKGVYWHATSSRWVVKFQCHGVLKYIGCFKSFEDAKIARINAIKKYGATKYD